MDTLWQDLRYALRTLLRSPVFLAVTVLTLAIGCGATTIAFSVVNTLLFRPLPVPDAGRVVALNAVTDRQPLGGSTFTYQDYQRYRDGSDAFSGLAAIGSHVLAMRTGIDPADQIAGELVSGDFFRMLGIQPALGRFILPEEDAPGANFAAVVLSHGLWRSRFAEDPGVIGRSVELNGQRFTIVGVAPAGFAGTTLGLAPDVWVPLAARAALAPHLVERPGMRISWLTIVGRLRPGVSTAQAEAALTAVALSLADDDAPRIPVRGITLERAGSAPSMVRGTAVPAVALLFGASSMVLLIACTNVAGMLLARASSRRREVAVRLALGAGTRRLVRQMVTESVVLFLLGGAAGLLLAYWVASVLPSLQVGGPMGRIVLDLRPDALVLGFALLVSLLTGVAFGLAPALQAVRPELVTALKDSGSSTGRRRSRLRDGMVVGQIAMSMLLLLSAGLLMRGLQRGLAVDPGFDPKGVALASMDIEPFGFTPESGRGFYRQMLERTRALPGVESATLSVLVPLTGSEMTLGFNRPGEDLASVRVNVVEDEYFGTLRIPLRAGRSFDARDVPDGARVVIVNEAFVRGFFPEGDPLGQRIEIGLPGGGSQPLEIVGVVGDSKYRSLSETPSPIVYQPLSQNHSPRATLHVRSSGSVEAIIPVVRRELQAMRPDLAVPAIPMERAIAGALLPQRLGAAIAGSFGLIGLLLAAVGLYGVLAYSVNQRTREIGIRSALGARAPDTIRLVLRHALMLVALGAAIGSAAGLGVTRVLSGLLFGVSPADPVAFSTVAALLVLVSLLASYLPARRALRMDPTLALRSE